MDYFKNCANAEDAKTLYRQLCKENHPDAGGSHEKMAEINAAYDRFQKYGGSEKSNPFSESFRRAEEDFNTYRNEQAQYNNFYRNYNDDFRDPYNQKSGNFHNKYNDAYHRQKTQEQQWQHKKNEMFTEICNLQSRLYDLLNQKQDLEDKVKSLEKKLKTAKEGKDRWMTKYKKLTSQSGPVKL